MNGSTTYATARRIVSSLMLAMPLFLSGCGAGGTATNAAAEAKAAKQAKQDMNKAQQQLNAAQKLQQQRLDQAEKQ